MVHRRMFAAVGFPRDEMKPLAMTLRRDATGLLRPQGAPRRHGRQLGRGVAVLPHVPALLRADVPRGARTTSSASRACARTTTGWSRSGAATPAAVSIPLIIVPLWDARARGRRDPPQRRARRAGGDVLRDPAQPRAAVDPLRPLGPVLPGVRRDRHRDQHARGLVVEDARDRARRAARGRADPDVRQRDVVAHRLAVQRQARSSSRTCGSRTARGRSGGSRTCSNAPTTCGSSTAPGPASQDTVPEPPSTYYYRQVFGCFFRDRHGHRVARRGRASTTSRSRPTTRTPTRPGPTRSRSPSEMFADLDDDDVRKIVRGNAIRMLHLDLEP